MTLRTQLDDLASALCKKAIKDDTLIEASTDALKALTAYYAVREKVKLKVGDDSGEGDLAEFNAFERAIHGADRKEPPNGRPAPAPTNRRRAS